MKYKIKSSYIPKMSFKDTLIAKTDAKKKLKQLLNDKFNLIEIEPSIITDDVNWINDDFNGTERPVDFDTKIGVFGQHVQSNVKYRRKTISDIGFEGYNVGILTDGLLIRRDRETSNISALTFNEIGFDILKPVKDIKEVKQALISCYTEILNVDNYICGMYKELSKNHFGSDITLVKNSQLKTLYPLLSHYERLNTFGRDNGSFIYFDFIKHLLDSKNWSNFSQDIYDFDTYCELYIYNKSIQQSVKVGWGGFQVGVENLKEQTKILREDWKGSTEYENWIKSNELAESLSISLDYPRIIMTILEKQHIAEVTSSIWEEELNIYVDKNGIKTL